MRSRSGESAGRCDCAGGASSRSVLEEGHLEPLSEEDFQSSRDPACEQDEGVVGAPARLDAIVVPAVHLLVVDADSLGEAAPGEALASLRRSSRLVKSPGSRLT